jgi:tetraacyldisaccharide 4'-kinase
MMMKTPDFWYAKPGLLSALLWPLGALYGIGGRIYRARVTAQKSDVPIVCIGNITMGGAGKTPTAMALYDLLQEYAPSFLLRGYGGNVSCPVRVHCEAQGHAQDVGDEALILAEKGPTIVSPDRVKGAEMAAAQGAGIILMDDGLQNPSIVKDVKLVVVDGTMGFGNRALFPAGPLRQSVSKGLSGADAVIIVGDDHYGVAALAPEGMPVFKAALEISGDLPPADKDYVAFAGIGRPQKFFDFLKDKTQLNIVKTVPYPDHHPYSDKDIQTLKSSGLAFLTTEKDAARLSGRDDLDIHVVRVTLKFKDESALKNFICDKAKI